MTGWQEDYKKNFEQKSKAEIQAHINKLRFDIQKLDKRTYNGKAAAMFRRAEIYALQELLNGVQNAK